MSVGGTGVLWDPGPTLWQPLDTLRHAAGHIPRRHWGGSQGGLSGPLPSSSAGSLRPRLGQGGWSPLQHLPLFGSEEAPSSPTRASPRSPTTARCTLLPRPPGDPPSAGPQRERPAWSTRELNRPPRGRGEGGAGETHRSCWATGGPFRKGLSASLAFLLGRWWGRSGPTASHPDQPQGWGQKLRSVHPARVQASDVRPLYY